MPSAVPGHIKERRMGILVSCGFDKDTAWKHVNYPNALKYRDRLIKAKQK